MTTQTTESKLTAERLLALIREKPGNNADLAGREGGGAELIHVIGPLMVTLQNRGAIRWNKPSGVWEAVPMTPPPEKPKGMAPREPFKVAGYEDDVTRVSCSTCGARSPCGSWPVGEPCLDAMKRPTKEWFHDARIVAAAKKSPLLTKWLAEATKPAPPAPAPAAPGLVATKPAVVLRAAPAAGATGPRQNAAALPSKLPLALLRQGKPRVVKLRDLRYDESQNVRGGEVIALALTHPDPDTEEGDELAHEIGELLESIPEVGLLEPPVCAIEADDSLTLVAGYRRCAAVTSLYGIDAEIVVFAAVMDEAQREAVNLAENIGRKGVALWRCIERCWRLKEIRRWDVPRIAKAVGYSESHASNLIRVKAKLAPGVWSAWTRNGGAVAIDKILVLLPYPPEKQLEMWNQIMGIRSPSPAPGAARERAEQAAPEKEAKPPSNPRQQQPAPLTVTETRDLLTKVQVTVTSIRRPEQRHYMSGAERALRVVLGLATWEDPAKAVPKKAAPGAMAKARVFPPVPKKGGPKRATPKKAAPKKAGKKR